MKLGSFFYHVLPIRKAVVLKNLHLAFPEKSESEIQTIALKNYQWFGLVLAEILALPSLSADDMKRELTDENPELFTELLKRGSGLIVMTAHFGNWEYAALATALHTGIEVTCVTKEQRNGYVTRWLDNVRSRWGSKTVSLGVSIRQIYAELKAGRTVALIADQRGPADGIRVDFFGRKSAVYTGPAALAVKTKAPVLFGVAIRNNDFTYQYRVEEIPVDDLPADNDAAILELSQRHTTLLERFIRQYPDQWFWMHNRWKY
jgi:KDO2-lipid IV(A) lauroyltransferase